MARGPALGITFAGGRSAYINILLFWSLACAVSGQEFPTNGVNGFSLHPPYFNLAEGTKITATATCGEDENGRAIQDLYCKLVGGPVSGDPSQTIQGQYCDTCTMGDSNRAHPITNAIDGTERWWQSPPLSRSVEYNEVNVTLDLGQLFHVAYVLIKFANSPRPDLWVLERSIDFGETYQPWQFFASSKRDCIERFGQRTIERIYKDNDVICTTEYSRIVPLENGEIVVSLVNGRPGAMNFSYSPVLRDFTKATNIRLRFLRTNTLLGHLMGKALRDPTVTRRYYYSIKDISIGGRCVCNGHAEACNAKDPNDPYKLQCDCQHNTCGPSCDRCCPGFNQMPWKPATTYSANECEPCNCNKHSFECYYDPEVDKRRASINIHGEYRGGGVCLECQHHTTGINCERCIPGYYRSPDQPLDSPFACSPCACQSEFTDGTCEDLTGRCYCKPNYTGVNCDTCAEGYINFPQCFPIPIIYNNNNGEALPAGEIINCECNAAGTEGNSCRPDPRTRSCVCKPGFTGVHCDSCAPGFFGLNCQACQCSGPGCLDGTCDSATGQCHCRSGFQGYSCEQCAPGYFNYPLCQLCGCSAVGSLPEGCDASGRCLCRPEFQGPRCEQCRSGFHSYPNCQVCSCDPRTSLDSSCSVTGHCHCRPNFSGTSCDQCAPGYYGYPSCTPCQCSVEGSRYSTCDQVNGQCTCLPNVVGQRCDSCTPGSYGFPLCQVGTCNPAGSVQNEILPTVGACECRTYVEGAACDKCKPLFWNLSPDTLYGCSSCECNTEGTLSSVAECAQSNGQCYCKPNVCSGTCSVCKDGFFNLRGDNYFGCQGCQCDIGGSVGLSCGDRNGRCQCRPNVEGSKCNQPRPDHYFPDLHHLKFEIEDGTMLDGRPVRFGYNPLEFEGFSWRGYAQMSPIQPKVVVAVSVSSPDLFHVVLRYVSRGSVDIRGRVSVLEDGKNFLCGNCSDQSKQIIFAPSSEPAFVNVPQNNFVEPFVLNPGTWTVVIEAEGILLDYLVLLPSAYYEAPILQFKVTEACTYSPSQDSSQNCLLYKYLSLDGFHSISGNDASCRFDNHLPRPCQNEKITPRHPSMAICSGSDINVHLRTPVPHPGKYVVVIEYASEEETSQTLTVSVNTPGGRTHQEYVSLLHCKYSFLCRVVSVDDKNRVAIFTLSTEADVQLIADRASFFLHKLYLIPHEQFTMEYLEPKVHCISTHGSFSPDSSACIPSRFQTPSQSLVLKDGQASSVQEPVLASPPHSQFLPADSPQWAAGERPPAAADNSEHVRLSPSQNAVMYSTRVQTLGRYVFILHYHQPLHPTFAVQVFLNGGRIWQGFANATFCPHGYGCRSLLISENQIILDVTDNEVVLTVRVPDGKTLWLDYVLVVPEGSYSSSYLTEEPLDKSYDFISNCGQNSFYINPVSASAFCRNSAVSLSAFFNNGALPCGCHEVGAESDTCEPFGGQCRCRPNVIGRDCSQCATGYWGFPNCRPCSCGTRLCDEVTGECICPPRTLRPECVKCEPQTFGCHPLVGCEVCNCSKPGITALDISCDANSGQCSCKDNIIGRQCDRCAPGFYGYPNCRQCDCNEAGTESDVCDSVTGQCLCKENVEGPRCGQCRVGTFHLDPTNPKGCTSCFCFGATDRCRSSDKRRTELMDMNGWVLLSGDRQEVPVSTDLEKGLVEADLSDVPDVYQDLHWHAPSSYLGDKVSSYGGHLRYRLHSQTQPMRGDVLNLPAEASRPDVILKGNQMTLVYLEREYLSPGVPHDGRVHLVEGSFRHAQTGNVVSREELMMVLVGLEALQIRALHSQSALAVSLRGVVLEGAESSATGQHASNVEICLCPANYQGDSCQQCAPGYYRDTKGLFLGKCVPCNCNGHSDQCLDGSGICVNCQHNTAGDHCEKCRGGFLGNSTVDGHAPSCTSCPCPLQVTSNNFAVGCVEKSGRMQCLCMPGYAGPHCERCAPGFYGNPMVIGSTCQPCQCHDNTDPNMLFSNCHPLTGECQGCMHNTAGPHCEVCAPGFYGDAVNAKNCTKCNCSPCGTDRCDPHTGVCHCKPGVKGAHCDICEEGMFGFETCAGCRRCDCDAAAALLQSCDPRNGTCACRPGVNGPHCRQCAPGHWDYSPTGCKRCECKAGLCDPRTGECRCGPGLTGKQCDTCANRYSIPVENGVDPIHCQVCDSCVIVLLEDLDRMNGLFLSVKDQLTNVNASSIAWAQLNNLNSSIATIANTIDNYNSTLDEGRSRADMLEVEAQNINSDIDELEQKAQLTSQKADDLENSTGKTHQRAEDLLVFIKGIMGDIEDISALANKTYESSEGPGEDLSGKLAQVETMLREMRFRGCEGQKTAAEKELSEAQKLVDRVKEELVNRLADNQAVVKSIRDQLSKFHAELMDLRDALNEAVNNTARASDTNNINMKRLEESRQKVEDLQKKQKEVNDLLQMSEDAVAQVNDLLSMLHDSKEEYERLAAQLDGARKPLAEKVQTFTPTVSKIPLVEAAEKHAELLDQLAKNLSSVIADTNQDGFIQRAVNASRAYTNIIVAVRDAENAAREADQAAMDALEKVQGKDLGQLADSLKNRSNELMDEALNLQDKLAKNIKPELQDAKKRLQDAKNKQESLLKDLETIQTNLNFSREETAMNIELAKSAAAQANNTAAKVEEVLSPMKEQLDQWQKQYGDSNTTNEDINNAFLEANKSVGLLGDTIPLLMKKLDKLQNHSTQMPNISENIQRIRQLIAQARNAANKVKVPVKFNGSSGVQVRTPSNLADLAAYTSLKFDIILQAPKRKRREDNNNQQFVLYLGNKNPTKEYLALTLLGQKLVWRYNLGGATAEVMVDYQIQTDGFNSVSLDRILQHGEISVSEEKAGNRVFKASAEAAGEKGLLNLSAEDAVFYVGGYPDNFQLPPELKDTTGFQGCIEMGTLNEEVLSLYNFEQTFRLNTTETKPCTRVKPALVRQWVNDAAYFDGTGYAKITFNAEGSSRGYSRFEQEVKVLPQNGIILLLQDQDKFLCLAVHNSLIKVFYDFTGEMKEAEPIITDQANVIGGQTKTLDVIILHKNKRLMVKISRTTVYNVIAMDLPRFSESYYLGGVPKDKLPDSLKAYFPEQTSIKGCIRNIKAYDSYIDIKRMNSSGVSYGCPHELLVTREAHFSGTGYISLPLDNLPDAKSDFYAGLGFRTDQKNGLMFLYNKESEVCQVHLDRGHVVVRSGNKEIKTQKTYNDANSHYVALYSNGTGLYVYVDDTLENPAGVLDTSPTTASTDGSVYLGGTPVDVGVANVSGCLSNLFVKRTKLPQTVVDLLKAKENVNAPQSCPPAKGPQQILASPRGHKNPKGRNRKPQGGSRSRSARGSCQPELSAPEARALHFSGSSHSYMQLDSLPAAFRKTPHFSMGVRVNSSDGLIFYVGGEKNGVAMMLSVSGGHFLLLIDNGRKKTSVRSRKKYTDNQWHTVFVKREGEKATLIVDGISAQTRRVSGVERSPLIPPLYIGGLPSSLSSSVITVPAQGGFAGCIRDIRLNEEPLEGPSHSLGVVPCFQDSLQPGVYFSSQGGHISIDDTLTVGRDLEILLEVRPVSDSGLLLHAGSKKGLQLSLYLNQGEVTVLANNGNGEFSASLTPEESVCNGHWHSITIVKKSNVIQLDVDMVSEHGVGPKQSRSSGSKETVYLGGVPDAVDVPGLPSSLPSFHGCVRRVVINQRPMTLSKPLSVHGAVGTQGCPSM
ncbi:laminin subunit alpha-5 isoform X1 [Megalops cyprinoides]|uniref:laminin subunit alpha-5 isoform X1 n=1 Tax=Megalops cyprinoides TaxID=118141 RepID=UPI00186544E1|nr:laminin subunit alpha-5 isoform X1 [Megalops cyprinoides]